ncbi:hypothetical protein EDB80DRAFT_720583 [Ilyonectria destructans]|nr:hypothetical protein EDB80DRAFT_720583 [Ilyonectria destructans]
MSVWSHSSPHLTRLDAFRRHVNIKYDLALENYAQLHQWSVRSLELFYQELWLFCGLVTSQPPSQVAIGLEKMWPRPQWFPDARMNFTENLLSVGMSAHPDKIAVSACREAGTEWKHLTWRQLQHEVARYASALRHAGVKEGDRVAAVATNSLETLLILLAAGTVGAIFSSTSPDMGTKGIVERYTQVQPKILFVDSEVLYGGKTRDLREKMQASVGKLRKGVKQLANVVVINGPLWDDDKLLPLDSFLRVPTEPLEFTQVGFDHPIYILYSSGTTGPPKCICHSGGGALLKHKIDLALGLDLGIDSTYYQYTTTGWMMWNLLVGALSVGSRIVLYDGNPMEPSPSFQLRLLEEQGVTHWGTSPKFLNAIMHDLKGALPPLTSLQATLTSGSALSTETFEWFYNTFPKRVALQNGSGGTDMLGGIVGGNNLVPISGSELAVATLGMDVQIWDESGQNIDATGERGELVITTPFPSMPVTFWGDGGLEKYRKAYFDTFPGIWCHGDFMSQNPKTKGYLIHGRSDGVLNPGGVRFGSAEIYNVVEKFAELEDFVAVGQRRPIDKDEQVLLFVKMRNDAVLGAPLLSKIRDAIRTMLSPRHVPSHIFQVQNLPYTMNGKRIENAIKSVVCGETVKNTGSIINPECLKEYEQYAKLPACGLVAKL